MLDIRSQLLFVSKDVIKTLDNRFTKYLSTEINIKFHNKYPEQHEELLLMGTFNSKIKVKDDFFNPYSEEFWEIIENNSIEEREYKVYFAFLHTYCFTSFCNYFDIVQSKLRMETARRIYSQYDFFLNQQLNSSIPEYNDSYRRYWKEIILRIINVLNDNGHTFSRRFSMDSKSEILNDLKVTKNYL